MPGPLRWEDVVGRADEVSQAEIMGQELIVGHAAEVCWADVLEHAPMIGAGVVSRAK